ncbi:MAG: RlmE family RNA methyltransferase, partial [Thermoplasmata archaeon]
SRGGGAPGAMARRFLAERRRDPYYRAARSDGLRSRAAFKLDHLARHYPIFRAGDRVLDLGAAPGGWSILARRYVGPKGSVVAVDPRGFEPIEGVEWIRRSVGDPALPERLRGRRFEVVLTDMSPRISGAYATDHARSVELARAGWRLARELLAPGGSFVAKVFDGDLLPGLEEEIAAEVDSLSRTKPPASRAPSSELYLIALGFRLRAEGTTPAPPVRSSRR